jgi:hypothetical protein
VSTPEVTRARGANGNIDLVSGGRIGLRGSVVDLTGGKPFVVLVE